MQVTSRRLSLLAVCKSCRVSRAKDLLETRTRLRPAEEQIRPRMCRPAEMLEKRDAIVSYRVVEVAVVKETIGIERELLQVVLHPSDGKPFVEVKSLYHS